MLKKRIFNHGNIELHYLIGPENGPPLVLLHGVSGRWHDYCMTIPFLAPYYTVYALNLRGHGGSSHADNYGCEDYAVDILAFLNENFKQPVSIVGHSLGALVTMKTAAESPQKCQSIILLDPPLDPTVMDNPGLNQHFTDCRDISAGHDDPKEIFRLLGAENTFVLKRACDLSQLDPAALTQTLEKSLWDTFHYKELSEKIACPVLLVYGDPELGSVTTEEQVQYLKEHIQTIVAEQLKCGHGIQRVMPVETSRHILHFLEFINYL